MKKLLINIALLFCTFILFFGGIELALRISGLISLKPNPPKIYQSSDIADISYELIANIQQRAYRSTVTTNSLGFRSQELMTAKPTIVVLGDSITFGYGLEDHQTIPARLQEQFSHRNILNAGVSGYNLIQQTATYREKIQKFNPEALVLIFHFNDVEEINMGLAKLDGQGILRSEGWKSTEEECHPITIGVLGLLPGTCWLDRHSAFYIVLKKFVNARHGKKELVRQEDAAQSNAFTENISDEALEQYDVALQKLTTLLPKNLPKLFVIWPERHLHMIARPKLKALLTQHDFIVLDLYEVFGNRAPTLGWDTVHPNAETTERAAEVIGAALEQYQFIR